MGLCPLKPPCVLPALRLMGPADHQPVVVSEAMSEVAEGAGLVELFEGDGDGVGEAAEGVQDVVDELGGKVPDIGEGVVQLRDGAAVVHGGRLCYTGLMGFGFWVLGLGHKLIQSQSPDLG